MKKKCTCVYKTDCSYGEPFRSDNTTCPVHDNTPFRAIGSVSWRGWINAMMTCIYDLAKAKRNVAWEDFAYVFSHNPHTSDLFAVSGVEDLMRAYHEKKIPATLPRQTNGRMVVAIGLGLAAALPSLKEDE